jgi:LacI family transcriptional regulator
VSNPATSSIAQGAKQIGYQAAALLHRLMRGVKPTKLLNIVPPIGVVTRKSTDVLAIEDSVTADAMTFIRSNYQTNGN